MSAPDAFRDEIRAWLRDSWAPGLDQREWHRRLVEGRWVVPDWPSRWGGRDATIEEQVAYHEEMSAAGAADPMNQIALYNIGPMLLRHGTEAQRERYLPAMVKAGEIWCQGFSEPDAGSDLASLRTRADDAGDYWIVTGHKIWTTYGPEADLCLALCRTDHEAPKHKGITALIVDMRTPGVEVRPLRDIAGGPDFSEIFFTGVRMPKENVVGPVNDGWTIALSTLTHERLGTMRLGIQLGSRLDSLVALARERGRDARVRQRIARLTVEVQLMKLLARRGLAAVTAGEDPGAALPLGKLQWSFLMQDLAGLALEIMGPGAAGWDDSVDDWRRRAVYSRMTTIGAGTTEVQRNIIAERILGMPRA